MPMITWRPWNPVAIKKVEPNDESEIENEDSKYSNAWRAENKMPREIVRSKLREAWGWLFSVSL